MNAETFTKPVTKLPEHVNDLRREANTVAQDLKTEAQVRLDAVKQEAQSRLVTAKSSASETLESVRQFAVGHPFAAFGIGVVTGLVLSSLRGSRA